MFHTKASKYLLTMTNCSFPVFGSNVHSQIMLLWGAKRFFSVWTFLNHMMWNVEAAPVNLQSSQLYQQVKVLNKWMCQHKTKDEKLSTQEMRWVQPQNFVGVVVGLSFVYINQLGDRKRHWKRHRTTLLHGHAPVRCNQTKDAASYKVMG